MTPVERTSPIANLERHPDRLPLYAMTLEATIANLKDETHRPNDPNEKASRQSTGGPV